MNILCTRCGEPLEVVTVTRQGKPDHKQIVCSEAGLTCTWAPVPYDPALADAIERAKWPAATCVPYLVAYRAPGSSGFGKAIYKIDKHPGMYRLVSVARARDMAIVLESTIKAWLGEKGPLPFRRWLEAEEEFGLVEPGKDATPPTEPADADRAEPWRDLPLSELGLGATLEADLVAELDLGTIGELSNMLAADVQWWRDVKGVGPAAGDMVDEAFVAFWQDHPEYCESVPDPEAEPKDETEVHGHTCKKVEHDDAHGFGHGPDDDSPYNVDGVDYCGRCHHALPKLHE